MSVVRKVKNKIKKVLGKTPEKALNENYYNRYQKWSFADGACTDEKQFEASITRLYHTVEKGLSYLEYRPGFGKENVEALVKSMEQYSKQYSVGKFFYQTAFSVLNEYVRKNAEHGIENKELSKRISALPGVANGAGGAVKFIPLSAEELSKASYKEFVETRHSIRHFSDKPVELERVENAVKLAQYTPSACNRQGWKTYIVKDKAVISEILKNQNGNRGFGQEFDKILIIVGDLRCFNRDREVFQVYIDGGMYAMRLLDSLYYERIASVPLSAALTKEQEENVRMLLRLNPAEVLIMFVGIGNYPDKCQTARSERKPAEYTIV
ncbi:nitroreductase family protein [Streptococcus suis]